MRPAPYCKHVAAQGFWICGQTGCRATVYGYAFFNTMPHNTSMTIK